MPGLLGKKIGMTSVFSAEGKNVPCTVIEAGPCVVTQVKTVEKDGYEAVQLGFQDKKEKHTTKPLMGHFKKAGVTPKKHLAEFKEFETELNLGDTVTVELFNDTTFVDVVGTSKGKGFQGVVKRHGFGGVGQTTHGQHNRTDIRFFWWITLRIMSRVCLLQDINVSHTEKIFLLDIFLRNRLCRVC